MNLFYRLISKSNTSSAEQFIFEWEERDSFSQKQGGNIALDTIQLLPGQSQEGTIKVQLKNEPWLLVLKLAGVTTSKSWLYPFLIEKNYPVNGYVTSQGKIVMEPYLSTKVKYKIESPFRPQQLYAYFYKQDFQSPFPPFSKTNVAVDPLLLPDSSFRVGTNADIEFPNEGLYLVQADTNSAEGFSFRVHSGTFPKYSRIEELVKPMIFISTKDEFDALLQAGNDKLTFDKTVLTITGDNGRARKFIKNYFDRVELANVYFSSYKEGWKTDQGMIYIIFGLPDEVRVTGQNEIWYYKNTRTKFVFVKRGSVYDPNYYVLMREDNYSELWYNTIDLWRKSRF